MLELQIPHLIKFLELHVFAPNWIFIIAQKVHVNNVVTSTLFRF